MIFGRPIKKASFSMLGVAMSANEIKTFLPFEHNLPFAVIFVKVSLVFQPKAKFIVTLDR